MVYSAKVSGIVTPSLSAKLLFFSIRSLKRYGSESMSEASSQVKIFEVEVVLPHHRTLKYKDYFKGLLDNN